MPVRYFVHKYGPVDADLAPVDRVPPPSPPHYRAPLSATHADTALTPVTGAQRSAPVSDGHSLNEAQDLRRILEIESVDLLIARTRYSDILALREINDAIRDAGHSSGAAILDFRFHFRLISIIGNRELKNVYRKLRPMMLRIATNADDGRAGDDWRHAEHAQIIDAIETGNSNAYRTLMAEHLARELAQPARVDGMKDAGTVTVHQASQPERGKNPAGTPPSTHGALSRNNN